MALTKPKASQINFDLTNISDPIIRLNSNKTQTNDTDVGFIFERGSTGDNAVIIWDESADQFVIGTTTATGSTGGDVTAEAGALSIGTLTLSGTAVTATAAELNYVDGVTSAIQTQIDGKLSLTGGTVSGATTFQNTVNISGASAVLQIGGASITASAAELNLLDGVTATTAEINYLDGVTSNIQTQIDGISGGGITEATAIEYAIALG